MVQSIGMVSRRFLLVGAGSLYFSMPALTQVQSTVNLGDNCSYFGEALPTSVVTFQSDNEAESTINEIIDISGLTKNFVVRAAGVPNAAAVIQGAQRLILYNQGFMMSVRQQTGTPWGPRSIMAHEIGHHLNAHTLDQIGSRPDKELEADYFSGFVLGRMGAELKDTTRAMELLGSNSGSSTHPAKHDRIAAITNGWSRATQSITGKEKKADEPRTKQSTRPRSDDSCEYANDGECDEPDLCERGTDATDCRKPARARPDSLPASQMPRLGGNQTVGPRMCFTPVGSCALPPGPAGIQCTCFSPLGPMTGVSQ